MNRDEAKYILRAYHLGGQDAGDPQFREALELSKKDPALAEWFAREQEIDSRLSEKFRSFPVPPDLKTQLIAARKVILLRPWWRQLGWISAAAASVVLLATLAGLLLLSPAKPGFADFRSYVAETTAKLDHLDVLSTNLVEMREWFQERKAPGDFIIPAGLKGRPSIGCRTFEWKGHPVSLICFKLDNRGEVHLFVIDRASLRNAPDGAPPEFAMGKHGIATASWTTDQRLYVLATDAGEQQLRRVL